MAHNAIIAEIEGGTNRWKTGLWTGKLQKFYVKVVET